MTDKWDIHIEQKQEEERLSLKIHIAVNIKTKEILALEVTLMKDSYDGKKLCQELIEHI